MKAKSWVGILSAGAVLATGIAAWAAGSEGADAMQAATPLLVAGQDLTGVSASPGMTSRAGEESNASKSSGPPNKSMRSLA